jgi:signal transduction histidine kinase
VSAPSLARRLAGLTVLSSAVAVVLAGVAFVLYDLHSVRQMLVARLRTDARIAALNSASAVEFDDAEAARATLASLQEEPSVLSARIVKDGRTFALYSRPGHETDWIPPEGVASGHEFAGHRLRVSHPITSAEQPLGLLFIESDLHEIDERLYRYALLVSGVSVLSILAAIVIARRVQRRIADPILGLAEVARAVSVRRDYAVRAAGGESADEVGLLVRTFNEMLSHIEEQHAALEQGRLALEARVEERTRELAAANKELEAFSYSVSHDLRAPLRAIDGFSKALLTSQGEAVDEKGRHYLARIRAGTQRMSELIDDLLLLARITRAELARKRVDLSRIAHEVGAELARREPARTVRFDVADGLVASADPHLLRIVFENLIGNAWKFTSRNPEAHVSVGRETSEGQDAFFVRDNGAGFDMAHADRLFGAFQRLHDSHEYEGTGIGLATVQRIVSRHGGHIRADAGVGRGASFLFTLGEGDAV